MDGFRPEAAAPPAVWSLGSSGLTQLFLLCPGTSPEGPMPGNGGEDEDAEGAAELPEAMAPEVPLEPQEPRSPQQVGPTLRPAELEPATRQALGVRQSHGHREGSPVVSAFPPWSWHTRAVGVSYTQSSWAATSCPLPAERLLLLRGVGWCPGCSCSHPGGHALEAFAASLNPKGGSVLQPWS